MVRITGPPVLFPLMLYGDDQGPGDGRSTIPRIVIKLTTMLNLVWCTPLGELKSASILVPCILKWVTVRVIVEAYSTDTFFAMRTIPFGGRCCKGLRLKA